MQQKSRKTKKLHFGLLSKNELHDRLFFQWSKFYWNFVKKMFSDGEKRFARIDISWNNQVKVVFNEYYLLKACKHTLSEKNNDNENSNPQGRPHWFYGVIRFIKGNQNEMRSRIFNGQILKSEQRQAFSYSA